MDARYWNDNCWCQDATCEVRYTKSLDHDIGDSEELIYRKKAREGIQNDFKVSAQI